MSPALVGLWTIALVGGAAVALVLVGFLRAIQATAGRIDAGGRAIWTVGKRVAQNTVQILLLRRTNALAAEIAADSGAILEAVLRIVDHAQGCPGCPDCLVAARRGAQGR